MEDAEDGVLEKTPISQGSVDSSLSLTITIGPFSEETIYYWMTVGRDYGEVKDLNRMLVEHGPDHFIQRTTSYWKAWVRKEGFNLGNLPKAVADLYIRSLLILRTNIDNNGAIIAGNYSDIQHFARDTYSYMWPRDGALTAYALDLAGYFGITRKFFEFCLDIIREGKESGGYFLHKYNTDGCLGEFMAPMDSQRRETTPHPGGWNRSCSVGIVGSL